MAGLVKAKKDGGTFYTVRLSAGEDARRPKIGLGRCTLKNARTAQGHIETLIRSKTGGDIPQATHEWVVNVPDGLRVRLERAGLRG